MIRFLGFLMTTAFVILSYSFGAGPEEYKSEIPVIVEQHQADVKTCAKNAVKDKDAKPIKGMLTLSWEVDEKGKPRNFTRDGGDVDNQDLYHCLVKKITKWKFPKPPMDRAIDVRHEFLF